MDLHLSSKVLILQCILVFDMASLPTPTLFFTFLGYFLSYMKFWMSLSISILTFHLAILLNCIEFTNFEAIDIFIVVVSLCIPK